MTSHRERAPGRWRRHLAGPSSEPAWSATPLTTGHRLDRYGYASPAYDACAERARRSLDPEARFDAYRCLQAELVEDRVLIPLTEPAAHYVVHPRLEGVEVRGGTWLGNARVLPAAGAD
jgi:ABC-type oligopeptide transport system substrate-binding subunit